MSDYPIDECIRVALLGRGARTRAETDRLAHDAAVNPKSLSARDVEDLGLAYFRVTRALAGTDDATKETK